MIDSLGWRRKFGVVIPSTNTSVQPEYDDMRPRGVTNHMSRISIPDTKVSDDASFLVMMDNIRATMIAAVDDVMSMSPDYVIMGMSAETFWDGADGAEELLQTLRARTGTDVATGSHACHAAMRCYGDIKRIAVVTPYMPVGDVQVRKFFEETGYEVLAIDGLRCGSPTLIAHETPAALRRAVERVDDPQVEAIIQVGTNLAFGRVAAMAEEWLDKPVIAINTATYWYALRQNGIDDKVEGYGSLLTEF